MALVGLSLPAEVSKELSRIKVPGKKQPVETMHITMFYLGKGIELKEATKCLLAAAEICKKTNPFEFSYKEVSCFSENSDDGFPIICKIDSPELMSFRKKLKKQFDEKKIKYSNKYPDYKPHTTLSYHSKEIDAFDIKAIKAKITELQIWVSDGAEEKGVAISIPLGGKVKKSSFELLGDLFVKMT